jgi:hypothetical protein
MASYQLAKAHAQVRPSAAFGKMLEPNLKTRQEHLIPNRN